MNTRTQTLAEWLAANWNPHTERRFVGTPHECLAVHMHGLDDVRGSIFWLADYRVSASVGGNFIELVKVQPDYATNTKPSPVFHDAHHDATASMYSPPVDASSVR